MMKRIPRFLWNKESSLILDQTCSEMSFVRFQVSQSSITDVLQPHHRELSGFRLWVYPAILEQDQQYPNHPLQMFI